MIFGAGLVSTGTTAPAEWIAPARRGAHGTVGALVPNHYASVVRVAAPPPMPGDWWSAYRELHEVVAAVGARHTSTPARAWFAVWEGHGFGTASSHIAWSDPPVDDADRRAREEHRARLRERDRRRNDTLRAELDAVTRFGLPHRTYYLLEGPVRAVSALRDPGSDREWRNPDLFWPDDRRWFVATDVDFWSLYIGGDHELTAELTRSVTTAVEAVSLADPLVIED